MTTSDNADNSNTTDKPAEADFDETLCSAMRHAMVAIITADQELNQIEMHAAVVEVNRLGLDYSRADLERDLADLEPGDLVSWMTQIGPMLSEAGRATLLRGCIRVALADGHVHDMETERLNAAGQALGMEPAYVRGVIDTAGEARWSFPGEDPGA